MQSNVFGAPSIVFTPGSESHLSASPNVPKVNIGQAKLDFDRQAHDFYHQSEDDQEYELSKRFGCDLDVVDYLVGLGNPWLNS